MVSTQPYATPIEKKTLQAVAAVAHAVPIQAHSPGLSLGTSAIIASIWQPGTEEARPWLFLFVDTCVPRHRLSHSNKEFPAWNWWGEEGILKDPRPSLYLSLHQRKVQEEDWCHNPQEAATHLQEAMDLNTPRISFYRDYLSYVSQEEAHLVMMEEMAAIQEEMEMIHLWERMKIRHHLGLPNMLDIQTQVVMEVARDLWQPSCLDEH